MNPPVAASSPASLSPIVGAEYETRTGNHMVVTGVKQLPAGRWIVGEIFDRRGAKAADFSAPIDTWRGAVVREIDA